VSGPRIHPTAVVATGAELDTDVEIGPYAIVGPHVRLGRGTVVGPHAVLEGHTTIGAGNRIFHHASVGAVPQDLKYHGEDAQLVVGDHNTIREFSTLHIGTAGGGMLTAIGDHNLLMNFTHVAHDCRLGNRNILANGAQLGGHVIIEDFVVVGALAGIHQFVRIGESAILGAGSMVSQDVPPFCNAAGDRARLHGLNLLGLKRRGFDDGAVRELKRAYRLMFQSRLKVVDAVARIRAEVARSREVDHFVAFVEGSERGVCR